MGMFVEGVSALPYVKKIMVDIEAFHHVRFVTMINQIRIINKIGFGKKKPKSVIATPYDSGFMIAPEREHITLVVEQIHGPTDQHIVNLIIGHPKFVEGIVNARDSKQVIVGIRQYYFADNDHVEMQIAFGFEEWQKEVIDK